MEVLRHDGFGVSIQILEVQDHSTVNEQSSGSEKGLPGA